MSTAANRPEVVMYTTSWCPYCERARALFRAKGVPFREIDVDVVDGARAEMRVRTGRTSVPQVFVGDHHVGGCDDTYALDARGALDPLLAGEAGVPSVQPRS